MLLPEEKERALRFKLALRIGLPVFLLFLIVSISFFSVEQKELSSYYLVVVISVFAVMIYYIFYLIYQGQEERITDPITHTFSREYLINYFEKQIDKGHYTILLVSVRNLTDINSRYGVKKGDKILYEVGHWIGTFLQEKEIDKFPIGHYKGSDFLIGLPEAKDKYQNILDLMCLKFQNRTIDEIEISLVSAIVDTKYSRDIDQLTTRLFDISDEKLLNIQQVDEEEIDPTELESSVIHAIQKHSFSLMFQVVNEKLTVSMLEASVKLINDEGKIIHQNKFMPVIDRLGLTRTYDEMILEKVVKISENVPHNLILAFSLSSSSVRHSSFLERTLTVLNNNESARGRIMFVLSENENYDHPKRYNELLQTYRRHGIFIAIDNFGSFKNSMAFLKELKVDVLRFDNNYGKHIKEIEYQKIVKGLNVIAQGLGLRSWIRMVEDETEKKIVRSLGIDFIQGNYLGKISLLEELEILK
ncbi:MAG: GGDEF domain-containing protein [Helicobacteraceae bacterium]|jgi:EAL domain-containing protein (putative c-di-GMP-specific phosphodiesterase class I)/GGDEF domain-containing protein|nr:GGDEF domain-containing protein [Helicobacteraceae bacterium]